MSAMVMCPSDSTPPAMLPRYPSPTNYGFNHFPGYSGQSTQYSHEFNQYPVPDTSVQQAWYSAMYGGGRPEDWTAYSTAATTAAGTPSPPSLGTYSYRNGPMGMDYNQGLPMPTMTSPSMDSQGNTSSSSSNSGSPTNKQLRPPYDWMKKATYQSAPTAGKTRTKDKYRVVYSDHQRLELEKEFHYSRYITIRRKAELAQSLALSERQVKIWFQNRRAKERKQNKKRDENSGLKMSGDLQDDIKPQIQQHMTSTHAHHHLPPQTPSPPPNNIHPTHIQHTGQQPQYQIHPQGHPQVQGHNQGYPSHLSPQQQSLLAVSPGHAPVAVSPVCSSTPVIIKPDHDAHDVSSVSV